MTMIHIDLKDVELYVEDPVVITRDDSKGEPYACDADWHQAFVAFAGGNVLIPAATAGVAFETIREHLFGVYEADKAEEMRIKIQHIEAEAA